MEQTDSRYVQMSAAELLAAVRREERFSPAARANVLLKLSRTEAMCVLAGLQLALRHTACKTAAALVIHGVAEVLGLAITLGPATAELVRRGFDQSCDYVPAPLTAEMGVQLEEREADHGD